MPFDCPTWPPSWPEIEAAVRGVIESGQWGQYHSERCQALQARLTETFQARHARLCCSGTAALEIALRAAQIGSGDEVILAAFDYPGNFRTVELLGARPVLVDVDTASPCLNPGQLEHAASDKVRAVIVSHLFGRCGEMSRLRELCEDRGWILIEDACQAIGMEIGGRPAGSFGHFATLSFGGSKLVSAGSGGALLVNSDRLAAKLGTVLDRPGETFPLSPLQAAVIEPQLDRLNEMNHARRVTAAYLEREVNADLSRWTWLSEQTQQHAPAYYKVAWVAESDEHRQRILNASQREGLPIGPGFRSMSRCSTQRCRKPVPTDRADALGKTLFVLDHRALLVDASRHEELGACLRRIHDQSEGREGTG